ncbi:MAG TPA: folylpolyglutamate synthase/dihydrofolate synthase family protein [Methylomirabilota bacterium]|nr:folylpolyglutamate synthase/dihydrofolate synthase family protein [Methylomirabilota bacterium]
MTYREAVARLLALRGGEMAGMRPGQETIQALLDAIGNPERRLRLVQVGGTNGKGSAAAMLATILTAAGLRVGLFTSPHLCSVRERIRMDGACIAEDDLADGMDAMATLFARLDASVFEACTALALDHFVARAAEVAVLEVGVGGRLDATTVGRPAVSVLTRVDYDHQALLGDTLARIAWDKAHIIRSGVAVSVQQAPEAERPILDRAAAVGVPLLLEGRELSVTVRARGLDGQRLDLAGPDWQVLDARCALLGLYQPANALVAAAAARALGAGDAAIRRGLAEARWPGRFQILPGTPPVVLDGAHNPGGARALADSLRAYFPGQPVTLVLGASADKDLAGILAPLLPLATRAIFTASPNPRAADPAALRDLARDLDVLPPDRLAVTPDPVAAVAQAQAGADGPVCVAGSLFLIGKVLAPRAEDAETLCLGPPR